MKTRVIFMLLLLLVACLSTFARISTVEAGYVDSSGLQLVGKPNKPGKIGFWSVNGIDYFTKEQTVTTGGKFTLNTRTVYSFFFMQGIVDKVEWYQVFKNKKPVPINYKGENYTSRIDEPGDYYFQAISYAHWGIGRISFHDTYKSNVMTVHVNSVPIDADRIQINIGDQYLNSFKNLPSTTIANAIIYPKNADGVVKWSLDRTDLATIDPDSGVITANNQAKAGTVEIKGQVVGNNNPDKEIIDTQQIFVGPGLEDQTVEENGTAKFSIQGDAIKYAGKVTWHRVNVNGTLFNDKKIDDDKPYLIIKNVNEKLKKFRYYAEFSVEQKDESGKTNNISVKTNQVKINVIPSDKPRIHLNFSLINETLKQLDPSTIFRNHLRRVAPNDKIVMQGTVTDENVNSFLKNGRLEFSVPQNSKDLQVWVEGVEVNRDFDPERQVVSIDNLDFSKQKSFDIKVQYTIKKGQNTDFKTTPKFRILDNPSDSLNPENEIIGEPLEMDFINDDFTLVGSKISFIVNHAQGHESSAYGQIDDPDDEALKVDDNRREKPKTQVFIHLDNDTDPATQPSFYYCSVNAAPQLISSKWLKAYETSPGQSLKAIVWKKNIKVVIPKKYSTTSNLHVPIRWEIRQSPKTDYDNLSNR